MSQPTQTEFDRFNHDVKLLIQAGVDRKSACEIVNLRNNGRVVLRATARHMNGRYWLGGIIKHRGHPFVVDCGHKHPTRAEAVECAECLFHVPPDSLTGEKLAGARG